MRTRAFSLIFILFLIAGRSVIGVGRFNYLAVGFAHHEVAQGIIADLYFHHARIRVHRRL